MEDRMMKKTYMTPQAEVVRIETTSIIAASDKVGLSNTQVSNEENLLGHDDDFDW